MTARLESFGYRYDPDQRVWSRPGFESIGYNDGDTVEEEMAAIIRTAQDVSVLSDELRQHCTTWPKLYHLSATRSNILRPLGDSLKGKRVLEIGAGCGAITRYLGECGAEVLALEGSRRRAGMAASRTRGLDNVQVVAEKFDQFKTDETFDVITLIGVLEYGAIFTPSETPHQTLLEKVAAMLAPGGRLIIAIENQLGLKYFAGAPEDHIGQPAVGLEGRYKAKGVRTFGRQALEALILRSGYASAEFYLPFPDYKLPVAIIAPEGMRAPDFDASAFAWQTVGKDPQIPAATYFALDMVWPVIAQNGLMEDVANSFLIIAHKEPSAVAHSGVLAWYYSTARHPAYCKETRFVKTGSNRISVEAKALHPGTSQNGAFRFDPAPSSPYSNGGSLFARFRQAVAETPLTIEELAGFLTAYANTLRQLLAEREWPPVSRLTDSLPPDYLDAVSRNIIIQGEKPVLIDIEWQGTNPLTFGYLLFRESLDLISLLPSCLPERDAFKGMTYRHVLADMFQTLGLELTEDALGDYIAQEAAFQSHVTGEARESLIARYAQQLASAVVTREDIDVARRLHTVSLTYEALAEEHRQLLKIHTAVVNSRSWRLLRLVQRLVHLVMPWKARR